MKTLFFTLAMYALSHNNSNFVDAVTHKKYENKVVDTMSLKGQWILQVMFVADTAAGKIPALFFDLSSGTFSGNTGCNTMRGSFQKKGTSLVFNQNLITTKMECTGYNEAAFIKSLRSTNRYKFDKGILVLMFNATELSRWTRKPQKPLKVNKA